MILNFDLSTQQTPSDEKYGKTFNLGFGVGGYYGYTGNFLPVFHIDFEGDVARNFTLAPFVSFYSYTNKYYWENNNYPYNYYYYHETAIPVGIKGTYYFDQILKANSRWDFYMAGSVGFTILHASWDGEYYGDNNYYHNERPIFIDIHAGTEYHLSNHFGLFLDISSGVSTVGLAIH